MLAMLGDLSERMNRMEVSQREQGGKNWQGSPESSIASRQQEVGAGINLQTLNRTPTKESPNVSPATYFGIRRQQQAGVEGPHARKAEEGVNMGQAPVPGIYRADLPEGRYPGMGMPNGVCVYPGQPGVGMPDAQQRKLALQPFDGKELYHGLGCGFMEWGKEFVRQVGFAERACGFVWPEDIKVDVLGQHLAGKAQTYYRRQVETWWFENQTLVHAMQRLLQSSTTKISPAQSLKLFTAPKASHRKWTDHFLYLTAVSDACGGADNLVLDNIVHYADPHMRTTMLSRLDFHRTDYLRQAEELAQFAQSTELDTHSKSFGRDVVNTVEVAQEFKEKHKSRPSLPRTDTRTCFKCGEVGQIRSRCPKMKKKPSGANYVFAVGRGASRSPGQWILDSGSSRHLVNDPSLLTDPIDCRSECMTAATDGSALRITLQGTVDIQVVALGVVNTVRLLNVHYAENLEGNILSYGLLEARVAFSNIEEGGACCPPVWVVLPSWTWKVATTCWLSR
uniref:CCHC-type domain-containing protein n=1 Tax=Peronospora matthiolae TaxID=2874970 RepID=A0AAV1VL66_9STRA